MNTRSHTGRVWRAGPWSILLRPRVLLVNLSLSILVCATALLLLTSGRFELSIGDISQILLQQESGHTASHIVLNIRLPRTLTAVFAGAALGISGAIFQSISRNALGSPDIIGFTTGAASGAIAHLIFLEPSTVGVALATITGGLFTAVLVYLLTLRHGRIGSERLVLIGIGTGTTLAALNGLMLVKGDLDSAVMANLWLAGSLNARNWTHALMPLFGVLLLLPLILLSARRLSLIEMGDDLASQLGVSVERTRMLMTLYGVLLAALATAATGPIAFIALAAPQLAIRLTGAQELPVCGAATMGAALLVLADLLTQSIPISLTLPIGRMAAIIGGLYLLWLLSRRR
ncbi:FecCD family ABC transporter permease [Marinobacterium iners]|uniref:Iron complex transport system permease protein n=1 Tax=Marinobacterium iners DSM 11526 TaxID=1122198 RepID=A0A1H3XZD4_9GAMM|nr:iron chelate uptake ABC transporter family permease subunit [Marinobacterium iners]SEA03912.1 iron complex transport system permease protein [Marinobacterium iners DSM 11526]